MKDRNEYLSNEAQYQDMKIINNPRASIGKVYNDLSSEYRYQRRNEMVGSVYQKNVLDLGCGNGFASMAALREGAHVTAIDISPKSIEYLLTMAKKEHLDHNLNAVVMDAHNLEIGDNSFDVVFGNGILHHLPDLHIAIGEIKRVLKPSGYAVFMEPLGMNPLLKLFRKMTPQYRTSDEQPFRMQELNVVRELFPEVRFVFFDCCTLLAKVPLLLGLRKLAGLIEKRLISLDDIILRKKERSSITFFQKMSWMVLIRMEKE